MTRLLCESQPRKDIEDPVKIERLIRHGQRYDVMLETMNSWEDPVRFKYETASLLPGIVQKIVVMRHHLHEPTAAIEDSAGWKGDALRHTGHVRFGNSLAVRGGPDKLAAWR